MTRSVSKLGFADVFKTASRIAVKSFGEPTRARASKVFISLDCDACIRHSFTGWLSSFMRAVCFAKASGTGLSLLGAFRAICRFPAKVTRYSPLCVPRPPVVNHMAPSGPMQPSVTLRGLPVTKSSCSAV